jgi:ubiquinone/menaquinone biosynthesis C-methylase UbiE
MMTSAMLRKVVKHAQQGTLLSVFARKVLKTSFDDPRGPDAYYGDKAKKYLERRENQAHWDIEQNLIRELLREAQPGESVLDVPFGTGRFAKIYLEGGLEVSGVEISPDMVAVAKETLGPSFEKCRVMIASADAIPFDENSFDFVVCCRFLGMTPFKMACSVLLELRRVAKRKIILYMKVRSGRVGLHDCFEKLWSFFRRMLSYSNSMGLGGKISEAEFKKMLDAAKLHVVERRTILEMNGSSYYFYVLTK